MPRQSIGTDEYYQVLVEFAVRHMDFQMAELESVLDMHGIRLLHQSENGDDNHEPSGSSSATCRIVPLPTSNYYNKCSNSNSNNKDPPLNTAAPITAEATTTTTSTTTNSDPAGSSLRWSKQRPASRRPFVILSLPFDSPFVPLSAKQQQPHGITTPTTDAVGASATTATSYEPVNTTTTLDIATIILSRCTLVRSVLELWGCSATSIQDCARATQEWIRGGSSSNTNTTSGVGPTVYRQIAQPPQSWKLTIHTLGTKYSCDEQNIMRQHLTEAMALPDQCPVRMVNPTNEFVYIREVALDCHGGPLVLDARHTCSSARRRSSDSAAPPPKLNTDNNQEMNNNKSDNNNNNTDNNHEMNKDDTRPPLLACYFGRALAGYRSLHRTVAPVGGTTASQHRRMHEFSLSQRQYLGPTSMDAELAFIMTNLAQVSARRGCVLDPFVGTGSILLSCALRGATYCVGTDIDLRVLRGRSSTSADENIFGNFRQFGLARPELIRSDNALYERHFRCNDDQNTNAELYDAIVCDPPYGIRAGARQTGSRRKHVAPIRPENRSTHIAPTQPYAVQDVLADLLDVAARTLVRGGRLVYIIPSLAQDFDPALDLPQHPCLELVHVCFQPLGTDLGRRMVVMRQCATYDPSERDAYRNAVWKNGIASAEKCANLRDKILENAKRKPNYEEKLACRRVKRRQHREEKKAAKRRASELLEEEK